MKAPARACILTEPRVRSKSTMPSGNRGGGIHGSYIDQGDRRSTAGDRAAGHLRLAGGGTDKHTYAGNWRSIQIGPQQDQRNPDQRNPDQNCYQGGGLSIRVMGAAYGGNCAATSAPTSPTIWHGSAKAGTIASTASTIARSATPGLDAPRPIWRAISVVMAAMNATPRRAPRPPASPSCSTAAASSGPPAQDRACRAYPGFNDRH